MLEIWNDLLSDNDRKVLAHWQRRPYRLTGLGKHPALCVIDVQRCLVGEDRPIHEQYDKYPKACGTSAWAAIRNLQKLIPLARQVGIPVIYTASITRPETHLPRADKDSTFSSLNPSSQIQPEIAPTQDDVVIEKQGPSFFFGTPAHQILHHLEIDTLLMTGTSTSGCVRASTIDAIQYMYKVNIIADCVFDRIELSHKASMFDIWFKYCDLISTDDALAYFRTLGLGNRSTKEKL